MGATIIVGAQWGDEGKGLISAYFSARDEAIAVCRAGTGPNAEHGIFLSDEKTYLKMNQLPMGWVLNPHCDIYIGSGVAVDPVKLYSEMYGYEIYHRVVVDYRCPIITLEHIEAEYKSKDMKSIGSTFSGTGYCRADFVLRKAHQARHKSELNEFVGDVSRLVNDACKDGNVVVESSQGTLLSLSVSYDYPNCTSDNVTAMAAADDVLLNWQNIKDVVLVVKALPTREGNGGMGQTRELSLDEINARGLVEASSIGGVTRRKSELDISLLQQAVEVNGATQLALTFCEHYDPEIKNVTDKDKITPKIKDLIKEIETKTHVPVTVLNTGKPYWSIVDLYSDTKLDLKGMEQKLKGLK